MPAWGRVREGVRLPGLGLPSRAVEAEEEASGPLDEEASDAPPLPPGLLPVATVPEEGLSGRGEEGGPGVVMASPVAAPLLLLTLLPPGV